MAKLYFYYSAMNAGKSTLLLQASFNYQERGMSTLLFTPAIDERHGKGKIYSRLGLTAEATPFDSRFNIYEYAAREQHRDPKLGCVLVDEAQFLSKQQVYQLIRVVDQLNIPVLAYGLRSDFRGEPFEGSMYLLILSDSVIEIKSVCHCGKKAIMNARLDTKGHLIKEGAQIDIGGNDRYSAVCRKHFNLFSSKKV